MLCTENYREIPTDITILERAPAEAALYYETAIDRQRRYAMKDFYEQVWQPVLDVINQGLTPRQREVVLLYYVYDKTQEDIAAILNLTQSTVSRHLFGTVRNGRRVGGAIPKLKKAIERAGDPTIGQALTTLRQRLQDAA